MQEQSKSETALTLLGTRPLPATKDNVQAMDKFCQMMDPKASPRQRWMLAVCAVKTGLHPFRNEIILYQGQPYVTIHGLRRLAEQSGDLAAVQPWIVTDPAERESLGACQRGDIVAGCRLFRRSSDVASIQYGIVRQFERWPSPTERSKLGITAPDLERLRADDNPDGIFNLITADQPSVRPVITMPTIMAMKRAEARALDVLAASPLPIFDTEVKAPITTGTVPPALMQADDGSGPPADDADPAPSRFVKPVEQTERDGAAPIPPAAEGETPWKPGEGPVPPAAEGEDPGPQEPQGAALEGTPLGQAAKTAGGKEG